MGCQPENLPTDPFPGLPDAAEGAGIRRSSIRPQTLEDDGDIVICPEILADPGQLLSPGPDAVRRQILGETDGIPVALGPGSPMMEVPGGGGADSLLPRLPRPTRQPGETEADVDPAGGRGWRNAVSRDGFEQIDDLKEVRRLKFGPLRLSGRWRREAELPCDGGNGLFRPYAGQ